MICIIKDPSKTTNAAEEVTHKDQVLPVEIESFWPLPQNKVPFQQFFIEWLMSNVTSEKKIYLGGSHLTDETACLLASTGQEEPLLLCTHKEADDRIMYHLCPAVKVDKYKNIVISSPDTDVLVCAICTFITLVHFGLHELWFVTGKSYARKIIPLHETLDLIESDVIDVLPALHALPGCDATRKVGTKAAALRIAMDGGNYLLYSFRRRSLTIQAKWCQVRKNFSSSVFHRKVN